MSADVAHIIIGFLNEIGIEAAETDLEGDTFLPGIRVENGKLLVDRKKLKYPGDLLHEVGHLAVVPSEVRSSLSDRVELDEVAMEPIEAQAIAWSYAAALHLGLDPAIVFHEDGYGGRAQSLLFNFQLGVYLGVNGLEDAGLTAGAETAHKLGVDPYPKMLKWVLD